MVNFTGYARKEEPKWMLIVAIVAAILLALLFLTLLGYLLKPGEVKPPSSTTSTTSTTSTASTTSTSLAKHIRTTTTTLSAVVRVSKPKNVQPQEATPVPGSSTTNELATVTVKNGRAYCYSVLSGANIPARIDHVWVTPGGEEFARISLTVSRQTGQTYSYISLAGAPKGTWQILIKDAAGEILARNNFIVD